METWTQTQNGAGLNRTGVYFSRYGTLMTVDAERVCNTLGFAGFVDEFCNLAKEQSSCVVSASVQPVGGPTWPPVDIEEVIRQGNKR